MLFYKSAYSVFTILLITFECRIAASDKKEYTAVEQPSKDLLLKNRLGGTKKPFPSEKKTPVKAATMLLYPSEVFTTEIFDPDLTPPPNVNITKEEDHQYYTSKFYTADEGRFQRYWVDMDDPALREIVVVHSLLSNSYRRAATVQLSFEFPFYGHLLRNITLATGGFIYMGGYMHTWLAATQYVAPLMGNFDTSLHPNSSVRFTDNGSTFTVEWKDVSLRELEDMPFTFQATLFSNGNMVFVYKKVPMPVSQINSAIHPVKVGLADAYTIENAFFHIKQKTIYEYHRVDLKRDEITNDTVIYISAAPTCLQFLDCHSCVAAQIGFECRWCSKVGRCSDGTDRFRHEWLIMGCDNTKQAICPGDVTPETVVSTTPPASSTNPPQAHRRMSEEVVEEKGESNGVAGGLVLALVLVAAGLAVAGWLAYAYRNPQSSSGQCLIRYRPSQWRWGRGEVRYTAAAIHM